MNEDFKRRWLEPLLLPLAAFAFVGSIAWGLSRFLLVTTRDGAAALALVASLVVLLVCAAIAARGFRKPEKMASLFAFVAVVAGGSVFAATIGIRPFHPHLPDPSATVLAKTAARFEQQELVVPAEEEIVVRFVNEDTAQPHNWEVKESEQSQEIIVPGGAPFTGVATRDYLLEGVEAGAYFYYCAVHPNMSGTLYVGEKTGEAVGSPEASPTGTTGPQTTRPSANPSPQPTTGGAPSQVDLVARDLRWVPTTLRLAANRSVVINLENEDENPHQLNIARDREFRNSVYRAPQPFEGPGEQPQEFAAPAAGRYFFRCEIHRGMTGTIDFV